MSETIDIQQITEQLNANITLLGITHEYTEEETRILIDNALTLCDLPTLAQSEVVQNDVDREFNADTYLTTNYPVNSYKSVILQNNNTLTEYKEETDKPTPTTQKTYYATSDGIIRFRDTLTGTLFVSYTTGLTQEQVLQYILPILVELAKQYNKGNLSSISEGDVSIGLDNTGNTVATLDSLVNTVKNKFASRLAFI